MLAMCHMDAECRASCFGRIHENADVVASPTAHVEQCTSSPCHDPSASRHLLILNLPSRKSPLNDQLNLQRCRSSARAVQRPVQERLCCIAPPPPAKRAHLIAESNLVRLPVIRPTSWSHELANLAVIVLSRSHDGEDEALTVATVS